MSRPLSISSSPHVRTDMDTQKIMLWVIIALIPAGIAGAYFFGPRVFAVIAASVASCVAAEYVWQKGAGQRVAVGDLSAVVTGVLIAYNCPPTVPLWMPAIGGAFAMIIVKHFFGGIGQNIVNPALAARAMMLISWPGAMTTWAVPRPGAFEWLGADAVTGATPLVSFHVDHAVKGFDMISSATVAGERVESVLSLCDAFIGNIGGCIGETSALAILIGFAILLAKKIISWRIPAVYLAVVAVLSLAFGRSAAPLMDLCIGGLMLGAVFMATDYTTSPMSAKGQIIYAVGCGVLTILIRAFGAYPEGVSFSILIMNVVVPVIDRYTAPRILGEAKSRVH